MTIITAPLKNIILQALLPDVVRSCILQQPSPPDPGEEPPAPVVTEGIYTPIAPGVVYGNLPVITVVDTSPDQMIGCIISTADNPQGRLDALFPSAIDGDGVIERSTNDIWVYDGAMWNNVGPTPGPTIVTTKIIPPWNEISIFDGNLRIRLNVIKLDYDLALLTEVPAITIRSLVAVSKVLLINVPSAIDITAAAQTPGVSTGVLVRPASIAVNINAEQPKASTGYIVAVPEFTFSVTALIPEQIGVETLSIQIPSIDVTTQPLQPEITTGFSAEIPAVTITITTFMPSAGGNLGERFDLTVLVEDDLLTLIE